MKHCQKCREEYEEWAEKCAECGAPLGDGPLPEVENGFPVENGEDEEDETLLDRPEDAETVFAGLRELGEPLALALCQNGIPAQLFACDPLAAGEKENSDTVEIVVTAHFFDNALWFVRGFEAAVFPPFEEDQETEDRS